MLRHVRWQVTLIVVGIVVLIGLMGYLAASFSTRYVPAPGGTYIEGVVGQPQYLNPLLCWFNDADRDICRLVFNGLVKFDAHGQPRADLAQSWSVSTDASNYGLVYTFNLRTDVVWQDDQPFTADDVIFTIKLLQDPTFPDRPDIAALWRTVEAVKVNNYTVQITLREPFAPFLDYASIGILPAHVFSTVTAADLLDQPFNRQPIGTGPFHVEEFVTPAGQPPHIVLATNPRYYGQQPFINKIEFKYYATSTEAFAAYRAGETQGIAPITLTDMDEVRRTPSLNLFTAQMAGMTLIFVNNDDPKSPFFKEKEVREALSVAIDRQDIVDGALNGQALVANSPFQPNSWAYDPNTPPVKRDIQQARQLLDRAGWRAPAPAPDNPDLPEASKTGIGKYDAIRLKNGVPLSFTLLVSTDQVEVARQVANQWRVVGVSAQVQPVQVGLASNYLQARQYQAAVANLALDTPDPDPYPFWHETRAAAGQNYSQFKDRDLSEVLESARRTVDTTERTELYRKFAQMFNDLMPSIVLYYPLYSYGVSERIRGVQLGPLLAPSDRFQTVANWFVIERRVIVNSGQFAP